MAVKINVGEHKRGDVFFVDPYQVGIKEGLRGRHKPPTDEQIVEMAMSLMDHGQRQAVEARKIEDNKLQLVLGFTRTAASRLIRDGFTDTEGEKRQNPEFMLKVMLTDANDKAAFLNNVVENAHRNQTSPIDDAFNQHILRDQHGMTDAEITRLYRYKDTNKVGRLRRLLSLPTEVQDLVHTEALTVQAAIDLLDLPDDARAEAIKAATDTSGVITGSKVREIVREHVLRDEESKGGSGGAGGGSNGEGTGRKFKARSMRDMRTWLQQERIDPGQKKFAKTLLDWLAGKRTNATLDKAFDELTDYERE